MKCTVTENIKGVRSRHPLHLIAFNTDQKIDYTSGDLIDVIIPSHPARNRQYSIAGGENTSFELIVRDAGAVGAFLCSLRVGDTFEAEYIGGIFHPEEEAVWISSGSGLAPFRSALIRGFSKDIRYFCNIDAVDEKYEITGPSGDVYAVYSYDNNEQRAILSKHVELMRNRRIYVCGSARYVTEICSYLGDLGIDSMYIETDMYGAATD